MRIIIVRHGETDWNAKGKTQGTQNTALSTKGVEQAHRLADRLKEEPVRRIFCSDLIRAYKTAEIIGNALGITPVSNEMLREVSFGAWEGLTIEEIGVKYPGELNKWRLDHSFIPSGSGESVNLVKTRLKKFIAKLLNNEFLSDETILLVCHALTSKVLITELLMLDLSFVWKFRIDNAAISILDVCPEKCVIISLNDTSHLKAI